MQQLMIADIAIRQDASGRYCLNDLHRASGGEVKHSPNRWTRTDGYQSLLAELTPEMAFAPAASLRGGVTPGTYVCKELVYAYAMWISPKFSLKVIRAYDQLVTGSATAQPQPAIQAPPLPDADMLNALLVMYLQRVLQNGAGLAAMQQLPPSTISADKLAHNVIEHREGERLHGVRRRVTLSPEQWETILDTVERGEESMAQLAREYGIAGSTISHRMTMRRQMRLAPVPTQAAAAPEEDGGFSITAAAKSLTVSPKTLFRWLAGHRWIYKRAIGSPWVAYQDKLDSGLLRQRQLTINHDNGRARLTTQVLVTPKGMARLVKDMVVR